MKFYDILAAVLSGILFLVLFLGLGWNLFVAILLAVGIYFALSLLLRPRKKIGGRGCGTAVRRRGYQRSA